MDHGTDAALACAYHREHAKAAEVLSAVRPRSGLLSTLRSAKLLKVPLEQLVNNGYTPTTLVASGATWSQLSKSYGASALLSNGFTWAHARASGISAEQACALGMDAFHISANELMEVCPSVENVASMHMPLQALKSSGFGMRELESLGLTSSNMRQFGSDLAGWASTYDCDWAKLGFTNYAECERHGWTREELYTHVFSVSNNGTRELSAPNQAKSGPLEF